MSRHTLPAETVAAWLEAVENLPVGWRGTVADIAARAGLEVADPAKSWGGLARIARCAGLLLPVGYMRSSRPSVRGSVVREWVRVEPRQERRAS